MIYLLLFAHDGQRVDVVADVPSAGADVADARPAHARPATVAVVGQRFGGVLCAPLLLLAGGGGGGVSNCHRILLLL